MLKKVLLELPLSYGLDPIFPCNSFFKLVILTFPANLFGLDLILILSEKSLEFLLLFQDSAVSLLSVFSSDSGLLIHLAKRCQPVFGTSNVVHKDVIDILVLL
jgi:hypothetical protein